MNLEKIYDRIWLVDQQYIYTMLDTYNKVRLVRFILVLLVFNSNNILYSFS